MPEYLQIPQVAELLAVSPDTVRNWIAKGELQAVDVSATKRSQKPRLRVLKSALDDFITLRTVVSKTQRRGPEKTPGVPQIV